MVNYCCVYGCGRNSRVHKHLTYYCVPKAKDRQEQWLRAAGREDLLGKYSYRAVRLCSRHFLPTHIKNKHLLPEAVPTLFLPGSLIHGTEDSEPEKHNGLVCNSCSDCIVGFRYKCIVCHDYDLCQKCEMLEVHPDHLMLRINKPMKFTIADNLVTKLREQLVSEKRNVGLTSDSDIGYLSSDDEPITKYTKEHDSGVDLPEDVKAKIRKEITRVLKCTRQPERRDEASTDGRKRAAEHDKGSKRARREEPNVTEKEDSNDMQVQELAFADVGEVKVDKIVKCETAGGSAVTVTLQQDKDYCVVLGNDFSQLIT